MDTTQDAYWMPFTANRQFKKTPRLLSKASGMHYWDDKGRQILDGVAGLWCVNAGHGRPKITQAIQAQAAEMDFAPPFQMAHPKAFELARRVADLAPAGMGKVFFTNSGSESVDTALKMALAYHRVRGEGQRTRLIGRERGYHGVNFGGISVGGMVANRKMFGSMLGGVDHIRHTHDPARNAYTVGQPAHGAELADDLERLVALHDASTIAAVIVEPVAGSTGVLVPPRGLPAAPARDLRQTRHPADLRRGHHRLRPHRQPLCRADLRRHARPDGGGQGPDQRRRADGRGDRARQHLRRLHERPGAPDRVLPRLHVLGPPAGLRRRPGHAGHLRRRRPADPRAAGAGLLRRIAARAAWRAERDRRAQHRPGRRHRAGAAAGRAGQARLRRLPGLLQGRRADPHHRRHAWRCRRR